MRQALVMLRLCLASLKICERKTDVGVILQSNKQVFIYITALSKSALVGLLRMGLTQERHWGDLKRKCQNVNYKMSSGHVKDHKTTSAKIRESNKSGS